MPISENRKQKLGHIMESWVVSDKHPFPKINREKLQETSSDVPKQHHVPLQGIFSEAGLLQPGPWAYRLLGNLQIHREAASQDWSRRYWRCPQMWCVWRPSPAWKQEIRVCFWWTCHGMSLCKVLLGGSLGTSNTGNFRKWIVQIQFLIHRGSTSFKRENNYIPGAWLPAVMRLRNVRVGLNNNSLFLTVPSEEDLEMSPVRIVYVTVLKGLVISP